MKLRNQTKFLLVFGIIFVAFLLFNTNNVHAANNETIKNTTNGESIQNGKDKTYIENIFKSYNFYNNGTDSMVNTYEKPLYVYVDVNNNTTASNIDNTEKNIENTLSNIINDNSFKIVNYGASGDAWGGYTTYKIYKNDIYYYTVSFYYELIYKIIVPNTVDNSEQALINYSITKMQKYFSVESAESLKKVSGYWYTLEPLDVPVIIKKEDGAYIGNNIYVDNLAQGININVVQKENEKMETELKNKGYTNILGSYELTLNGADKLANPIDITFNVGTEYNNKKIYILHKKKDGTYENFEKKVTNGKVKINVSELSSFVLGIKEDTIKTDNTQTTDKSNNTQETTPDTTKLTETKKGEKDETPKTGTIDIIGYILLASVLSGLGIVALKKNLK